MLKSFMEKQFRLLPKIVLLFLVRKNSIFIWCQKVFDLF
ncbi:hypothetical protein HMPREF1231_0771 [Streptococcus pyogenes GA06023]|nr:hypothetical protein HMPREF1231_0771 [Streptococcus pyogenes GA06023]